MASSSLFVCLHCASVAGPRVKSKLRDVCEQCYSAYALKKAQAWYAANKDRRRAYDAKRRQEKRSLYREASRRNRQMHPDKKAAETGLRRKRTQHATPAWADRGIIKSLYLLARIATRETGELWHVDHEIPLRGKTVCGLHVPENLRLVPAVVNLRKHNHYSLEHEGVK